MQNNKYDGVKYLSRCRTTNKELATIPKCQQILKKLKLVYELKLKNK